MPKKIVIVGGVAGGMSTATRARRLDESASITVFEMGAYTSFANCGIPYALGNVIQDDAALILHTPDDFQDRFNITVHLNTEVIHIDRGMHLVSVRNVGTEEIRQVDYDKLILSQGAEPFRPAIEGDNLDHVFTLHTIADLHSIRACISERNVKQLCIIGAGSIGLEAAENARNLGLEVSLVEFKAHVLPPIDGDMAEVLHTELRRNGVKLFLSAGAKKIEESRVLLTDGTEVPAQLVLVVAGVIARTALAKKAGLAIGKTGVTVNRQMQTSDPDIYAVGDMVETENKVDKECHVLALAGPANRQGRMAADHIFGRHVEYRGNVGTSVCHIFGLTIGFVGISVDALHRMGRHPLWVTVHPPDHASYYPGAHPVTLKVIFDKENGRLWGAQAVGQAGVDKRIDVIATAMQAGMTIFDLEHLELAYAPPYGSAKDPVNMAGFVGSNVLRGDSKIIHAEDLVSGGLAKFQIIDVRSAKEFSRGHIPSAINIPVDNLRGQVTTLDISRPAMVYCQVGYRGYLAFRILKQAGFDVVNLDGGFKTLAEAGFLNKINENTSGIFGTGAH
ncbi:FAD-dependent pyridine nucleotide-disulfide oxidoreductase [Thozetella sp. PMI_491]|nr:FAD-dependent pyridine nucleotide-disulfide oxidoreductase [Thozetella sp. PMI_491]